MAMKCGHDEAALRMTHSGATVCSGCQVGQRTTIVTGAQRCHERNGINERCAVVEHQIISNRKGQAALVHETKNSVWSTPILRVVGGDTSPGG